MAKSEIIVANKLYALGHLKPGELNKTEQRYELLLKERLHTGEIAWYKFQGMTFKLAIDTRYTPDFNIMLADGRMEHHEIKSIWLGDAKAKIKVAAAMFPFYFVAVYALPKKKGGGWKVESF